MLSYDYEDKKHLLYWPESQRFIQRSINHKALMVYTMPGIKDEFMRTSIDYRYQETFNKYFSQFDIETNQKGLNWFIKKGLLDVALNGTTELLTWLGQGKNQAGKPSVLTRDIMEVWALRFQLLLNLRMHAQILAELAAFEELDAPDLYYQYRSNEKTGSLVPFSLRLIHAEALRFSPFPWKALVRVQKLLSEVEAIIETMKTNGSPTNHISDWEKRRETVQLLYVRVLYELGEYKQVMDLLEKHRANIKDVNEQLVISRVMMRMAMQAGDEKAMNVYGEKANKINNNSNEMILHKTLRSIFLGAYSHAQEYVNRLKTANFNTAQAINTSSIVQLYTGKARQSVETIRKMKPILAGPSTTNLKTMAELCYSTAAKDELLLA